MKRVLLLFFMAACSMIGYCQAIKSVAILEVVDRPNQLEYGQKLMIRSGLCRAITNTKGFEAFDRTDIDAIMSEHDFQRTGLVSEAEIKEIGEMTGAAYVLVAEGVLMDGGIYLTAKILNVETSKVEVTDNVMIKDTKSASIQNGCRTLAANMFGVLSGTSTSTNKFFEFFHAK